MSNYFYLIWKAKLFIMSWAKFIAKKIISIAVSNKPLTGVPFVVILSWKLYCMPWASHTILAVSVASSVTNVWMECHSLLMSITEYSVFRIITNFMHPSVPFAILQLSLWKAARKLFVLFPWTKIITLIATSVRTAMSS